MSQPLEYEQLTYNSPDGAQIGRTSSEAIGFYGKTPVTQYVGVGAASTYSVTSNTTSTVGFTTLADLTSFILQVSTITQAGRALGLWA